MRRILQIEWHFKICMKKDEVSAGVWVQYAYFVMNSHCIWTYFIDKRVILPPFWLHDFVSHYSICTTQRLEPCAGFKCFGKFGEASELDTELYSVSIQHRNLVDKELID
jgi:hypothetical protein